MHLNNFGVNPLRHAEKTFARLSFSFVLLIAFSGCEKDNDPVPVPVPVVPDVDNKVPVAHAGTHHELTLPADTVYLKGSGIDSDGVVAA